LTCIFLEAIILSNVKCAKELGYDKFFREGVYSMLTGPSYETVTECRFLLKCGVDATGL
jgi:purine-nucleoside phosphorylase